MTNRPHISPSQVNKLDFCEVSWSFKYLDKLDESQGYKLIEGGAMHKAAELNNRHKMVEHVDLPIETLQEAAVAEVVRKVEEKGIEPADKEERDLGRERLVASIKDSVAYSLIPLYLSNVAPLIQPIWVEESILIELPNATHDMLGIIDVATADNTVRDLKVTGRSKGQQEADESLQLTWYHAAFEYKMGYAPSAVAMDVMVKTKVPKTQVLLSERDDSDVDVLLSRVNGAMQKIHQIESGIVAPKPAPIGSPMCSPKYCSFHPLVGGPCRHVTTRRTAND